MLNSLTISLALKFLNDLSLKKLLIVFWIRSHTLSQYPCWIQPGQFPSENLVRKIIPRWKWFEFSTSPTILHNLVHPGKNLESLMVPSVFFFNFTRMRFDITTLTLLSPWCVAASRQDHGNPWSFPPEY